jgi:hypothetical protein
MTVKLVRLRNGEDIIADIKEVVNKETNQAAALQFDTPYMVMIEEQVDDMFADPNDGGTKITNPRIRFFPWVPLSKDRIVYIDPTQIVCLYEPYQQVLEQYQKVVEAMNHGGNDGDGGNGGNITTELFPSESNSSEG